MDLLRKGVAAATEVDPEDIILNNVMKRTDSAEQTGLEVRGSIATRERIPGLT